MEKVKGHLDQVALKVQELQENQVQICESREREWETLYNAWQQANTQMDKVKIEMSSSRVTGLFKVLLMCAQICLVKQSRVVFRNLYTFQQKDQTIVSLQRDDAWLNQNMFEVAVKDQLIKSLQQQSCQAQPGHWRRGHQRQHCRVSPTTAWQSATAHWGRRGQEQNH
jgi:hypothetical protein